MSDDTNDHDEDICGHPTADGEPCQHPASDGDSCWLASHGGDTTDAHRPATFDDEHNREMLYKAAAAGLTVSDQAGLVQVHPDTLRRALCCVETPRSPEIVVESPCEFCEGYVQAHAEGALAVLQECRPEFRASATYGYVKEEKRDVSADVTRREAATETDDYRVIDDDEADAIQAAEADAAPASPEADPERRAER